MQAYRADLQILRGLSVVFVFLYHLQINGFANGYLGVDVFFVLSGYLMAILAEKSSPMEFYKRRLRRLLPAYLVTVAITTAVVILIAVPVDADQRLHRLWFDLLGLSNIAFWLENSYFNSASFKPLLNLWSLGVELQFYLIAPFLIPFLKPRPLLLMLLIFGFIIASLIVLTISPKTSFFMLPFRLWEFLAGVMIAWFPIYVKSGKLKTLLVTLATGMLIGVMFFYPLANDSFSMVTGHPGLAAVLVTVSSALLIGININENINMKNIITRIFVKLGDYSYSIYLTHFPIIVLINYTAFGGTQLGAESIEKLLFIVFATGLSSFLMFNYVERLRYRKGLKIPLGGLTFLILGLGLVGSQFNQSYYSNEQNKIFNAWEDRSSYRCGKVFRLTSPTEKICRLGKLDNDNRVLLLGNSHADSIKTAFSEAMNAQNLSTYFYVSNGPLMSPYIDGKLIAELVKSKNISNIAIHYSASFYSSPENVSRLVEFISLMKKKNILVKIIAPVPVYDLHIPKAMMAQTNNAEFKLPSKTKIDYMEANTEFFNFVSGVEIEPNHLFLPHELLCNNKICIYEDNYTPYYYDEGHLTLTGARVLIPMLKDLAKAFAGQT